MKNLMNETDKISRRKVIAGLGAGITSVVAAPVLAAAVNPEYIKLLLPTFINEIRIVNTYYFCIALLII